MRQLFVKLQITFPISMYIMCTILGLFSALSHETGALQIYIPIIIITDKHRETEARREKLTEREEGVPVNLRSCSFSGVLDGEEGGCGHHQWWLSRRWQQEWTTQSGVSVWRLVGTCFWRTLHPPLTPAATPHSPAAPTQPSPPLLPLPLSVCCSLACGLLPMEEHSLSSTFLSFILCKEFWRESLRE